MSEYSQLISAARSMNDFSAVSLRGLLSSDHQLHDTRPERIQLGSAIVDGGATASIKVDSRMVDGEAPVMRKRHGKDQGSVDSGRAAPTPFPSASSGRRMLY